MGGNPNHASDQISLVLRLKPMVLVISHDKKCLCSGI